MCVNKSALVVKMDKFVYCVVIKDYGPLMQLQVIDSWKLNVVTSSFKMT